AAARGAALVRGVLAREFGEIGATGDARAQGVQLRLRLGVVAGDQDLPRLELGDGTGVRRLARLDQVQQLEAARAADRADHLARLHRGDDLRERGRDLVQVAPAQVAAFQRVGAVGVA